MDDKRFVVRYDEENDVLFIRRAGARPAGAIEVGEIVISFEDDQLNRIVGLELLNASRVLSELHQTVITRTMLEGIKAARIAMKRTQNTVFVVYAIRFAAVPEQLTNSIPLPLAARA